MSSNRFASLLKQERKRRGWTQERLADELNTTRVTVNRWERGVAEPTLSLRSEICALLGKRMEDVFPIDVMDPLMISLPVEPALSKVEVNAGDTTETSILADGNVIRAGHRFELAGSKDHLTVHETPGESRGNRQIDQGILTQREAQQLDSERHRLELQEKRLELQAKYIEQAIIVANQVITVLDPTCDATTQSLVIEELLTVFQQDQEGDKQELSLPTVQSVREALERVKTHTESAQTIHSAYTQEDALRALREVQTTADWRNPYGRFTAVLDPQEFAGRGQVIQSIYAALARNQSVSLVGLRGTGKSSVLQYLCTGEAKQRFGYQDALYRHLFVFKDLREFLQESSEDFFQMLNTEIVSQSKDSLILTMPKERGAEGFRALLDLIRAYGFRLVLLLDEFDKMPRFDLALFEFLRAQADLGKVSYVVASRTPLRTFFSGSSGLDFFEVFGFCRLGPLTTNEARELIVIPA